MNKSINKREVITFTLDGERISVADGITIADAARLSGVDIPTMCHDESVKPEGACGLCVVEVEGSPRLARACSTSAKEGMVVRTNTEKVREARKFALEMMLAEHDGLCKAPCSQACPAGTDCQGYIGLVVNGEYETAAALIREQLPFPSSIGRVCPRPCEAECSRKLIGEPISIAAIKRFAGDMALSAHAPAPPPLSTGKRVAVVGGGPAGLTAAYFLRQEGHYAAVYEAMPKMGGMLMYGVPEYRLPKAVLDAEIDYIQDSGVVFHNDTRLGRDITIEGLRKEYDAVLLTIGAWKSSPLYIAGEDLDGVIGGVEFLRDYSAVNITDKRVVVIGGGNTAVDACRTAIRLGASSVVMAYRRTKADMPAQPDEIAEAEEEGVTIAELLSPIEITGSGHASGVTFQVMKTGDAGVDGRRSSVPDGGKTAALDADVVITAVGQTNDNEGVVGVNVTRRGSIEINDVFETNIQGVFAAGDGAGKGAGIAVQAIGDAKRAAFSVGAFLRTGTAAAEKGRFLVEKTLTKADFAGEETIVRVKTGLLNADIRKRGFREVNRGYSEAEAIVEAGRCLECGCLDYYDCKLIRYANEYGAAGKYSVVRAERKRKDKTWHDYFSRDLGKCVLCGLCVRVCAEHNGGKGVLSFVNRGIDTAVSAGFPDKPHKSDGCESCGMCVAKCPTGALRERYSAAGHKDLPIKEQRTETYCVGCDKLCPMVMSTVGKTHMRNLPTDDGYLCGKGRFGFTDDERRERVFAPMVRRQGILTKTTIQEAAKIARGAIRLYGDKAAVLVSSDCSNEEIGAALATAAAFKIPVYRYGDDDKSRRGLDNAGANRRGIDKFGVDKRLEQAKDIRAVIDFGGKARGDYEFVCVFVSRLDPTALAANVVIPAPSLIERDGTYTGEDGDVKLTPAYSGGNDFTHCLA